MPWITPGSFLHLGQIGVDQCQEAELVFTT